MNLMPRDSLLAEIGAGVNFWAWDEGGQTVGVMGLQKKHDITLIRHAYVSTLHQGKGVGGALMKALTKQVETPLLVGAWKDAVWAIRFYERHGFSLASDEEKQRLLHRYWTIPARQIETSVVLTRTM